MVAETNLKTTLAISLFSVVLVISGTAHAKIIYVDDDTTGANNGSSWANAYNFLQDALADANSADKPIEIRVAQGLYKPDQGAGITPGDRADTLQLKNGVAIKGGYAGFSESDPNARDVVLYKTTLTGDLNGDDQPNFNNYFDNSFHVVTGTDVDQTAILDGFTIRRGNADATYGDPTYPRDASGGGLLNENGAGPTIRDCTFRDNKAFNCGGAICNDNTAKPSLLGCTLRDNWSDTGAGMYNRDSSPSLKGCTFENNWANINGGGMYNSSDSHPELFGCTFVNNQADIDGGAMYNRRNASAKLVNCAFYGNRTEERRHREGGAIHSTGATLSLVNCIFSGNLSGYRGGALYVNSGEATLLNCSFFGNEAVESGGGMSAYTWAKCHLTNCIFRHNVADGKMDQSAQLYLGTQNHNINYCSIEGWSGQLDGQGNNDADPLFVDADGPDNVIGTTDDNFRLLWDSPCLDNGDNTAVASIQTDIAGNPRIINGTVDRGAYEGPFQGIVVGSQFLTVPEAGVSEFGVWLAQKPQNTVQVTVQAHNGDPDIDVASGAVLTFKPTDYDLPHMVTLSADEDDDYLAGITHIRLTASNLFPVTVTAQEQDNEPVPTVLFVDAKVSAEHNTGTSWTDAFSDLQEALAVAAKYNDVQQIRVAAGVYSPDTPNGHRKTTFQMLNNLAIKGGYAGNGTDDPDERDIQAFETIISGDLNGDDSPDLENNTFDNAYCVVTGSFTNETAVLQGFTITAGYNRIRTYPYCNGAGLFLEQSAMTVRDCTFRGNHALDGGAVYVQGDTPDGHATFTECIFVENNASGGGAAATRTSSCRFSNCLFENNQAHSGGAVSNEHSTPVFTACRFINNYANYSGGAVCNDGSAPQWLNCTFESNRTAIGSGGGIFNDESSAGTLINCLFIGNIAANAGGASFTIYGDSLMLNCTIVNNTANQICGGVYNEGDSFGQGNAVLTNCIIWANSDPTGSGQSAQVLQGDLHGRIVANYCCIQGWTGDLGGVGNFGHNPMLVDLPNADLHLQFDSPCIDAGDPDYIAEPNETDLDGKPRIIGGRIDMGAYESPLQAEARIIPRTFNLTSKGNWITSYIWLSEDYDVADIDSNSVFLEGNIKAKSLYIDDQEQVATAKFSREQVLPILTIGEVELTITGQLTDGTPFEAADIIRVLNKAAGKPAK